MATNGKTSDITQMTDAEIEAILAPLSTPSVKDAETYDAAMTVTQVIFVDVVRCTQEIVSACSRGPGGLRDIDLDTLAEATWETLVSNMKEATVR